MKEYKVVTDCVFSVSWNCCFRFYGKTKSVVWFLLFIVAAPLIFSMRVAATCIV